MFSNRVITLAIILLLSSCVQSSKNQDGDDDSGLSTVKETLCSEEFPISFGKTATFAFVPNAGTVFSSNCTDALSLTLAKGEIESASLTMSSSVPVRFTGASFSDLETEAGDTISSETIDLKIVNIWDQQGSGVVYDEESISLGELLLNNDEQEFDGGFTASASSLIHTLNGDSTGSFKADGKGIIQLDSGLLINSDGAGGHQGTIAFDFQPRPDKYSQTNPFLFQISADPYNEIHLFINGSTDPAKVFAVVESCEGESCTPSSEKHGYQSMSLGELPEGEWTSIAFSYSVSSDGDGGYLLQLSGSMNGVDYLREDLALPSPVAAASMDTLFIGSSAAKRSFADGHFRNLKLYSEYSATPLDSSTLPTPTLSISMDDPVALESDTLSLSGGRYLPPVLREDFLFTIDSSWRQLWVTIEAPADAVSGNYQGILTLSASEIDGAVPEDSNLHIPISVEVLPFELLADNRRHGMYINRTPYADGASKVSPELWAEMRQNLLDHGVNSPYLTGGFTFGHTCPLLTEVEEEFQPVMLGLTTRESVIEERIDQLSGIGDGCSDVGDQGVDYKLYTIDEPNPNWTCVGQGNSLADCVGDERKKRMVDHVNKSKKMHDGGAETSTALSVLTQELFADVDSWLYTGMEIDDSGTTFSDLGMPAQPLDYPLYHSTHLGEYDNPEDNLWDGPLIDLMAARYAETDDSGPMVAGTWPLVSEGYYWQSWTQRSALNRIKNGFFHVYSGMELAIPFGYLCIPGSDDVAIDPFQETVSGNTNFRRICTVYPAQDKVINTVQWEGYREGVDDLRYIITLEDALNSNPCGLDSATVSTIHSELRVKVEAYAHWDYHLNSIDGLADDVRMAEKLDQDRRWLISKITELRVCM